MLPATEPEIAAFLQAFESCTLPKEEWSHAAHILTGACYVHALGPESAIAAMRSNLRRFNESVGGRNTPTSGYHETVTVAWIKVLAAFLRHSEPIDRATFVRQAVAHFAPQRDILTRHYSFDLTANSPSRLAWIEPDLAPLP